MALRSHRWLSGLLLAVVGLVGCSSERASSYAPKNASYSDTAAEAAPAAPGVADGMRGPSAGMAQQAQPQARPGLGTQWGETRVSEVRTSTFTRADAQQPFSTGALFYNDEEGAKAMANQVGFRRTSEGSISIGGGIATMRLKDGSGHFLTGFEAGSKKFVVGTSGDRYTIVITSHVPARLEAVVSVDGLDVLDGREATPAKRGYIVDPFATVEIDGFRQSTSAVAAFRFGSVRGSYAEQKHGDSRNVGVIGIAMFNEQGTNPSSWPIGNNDANQRLNANPFPGRFATPPN